MHVYMYANLSPCTQQSSALRVLLLRTEIVDGADVWQ